ncbi:MAG TPA: cyclic nucleotide-binding domain-containing protein [Actinomycetota bacterium]|nr:cyclic nucleotide-binding domain-containing protein [Actinomycetota bacterium]
MPFKTSKIDVLKNVSLFSACTNKELGHIASLVDEVDVPSGAVLTKEGAPGREFFAIIDGRANVTLRNKKLATLGPGAFFGEMSLLDQGPRAATVTADSQMRLYVLDGRSFSTLLDKHPAVARKILRVMAQRLREIEKAPTH